MSLNGCEGGIAGEVHEIGLVGCCVPECGPRKRLRGLPNASRGGDDVRFLICLLAE